MTIWLYLLSIMGNYSSFFSMFGVLLTIVGLIGVVGMSIEGPFRSSETYRETNPYGYKLFKRVLVTGAIALFIALLIPSKSELIKAYIILEGPKVINTTNIEKVAQRADRFLDILDNKNND